MSNAIEDKLVATLLNRYHISGINYQNLLDNPIFQSLPLDRKIRYIEKNREYLSSPPKVTSNSLSPLITGAVMGGIGGAATLYVNGMLMGGKPFPPSYLAAAAGLGAVLGTVSPGMALLKNMGRDKLTQKNISQNKYITALIDRSISSPTKPKDVNWNVYTDMITAPAHKFLTDVNAYEPNTTPEGLLNPNIQLDSLPSI